MAGRAGEVTVLGKPASELGHLGAASRVGMLFQHGALFSAFTVLENIAFPLRERGTLPASLVHDVAMVKLQMVGLDAKHAHKMPADLSGGMVKRVALATLFFVVTSKRSLREVAVFHSIFFVQYSQGAGF